jgi:hypothetical protein
LITVLSFNHVHVASLTGSHIIAPQGRWRNTGKKGEGARESSTSRMSSGLSRMQGADLVAASAYARASSAASGTS